MTKNQGNKKSIMTRIYLVYGIICLVGFAILFQIFNLQILQGSKWQEIARLQTLQVKTIEPVRGNIFAADGSLLATSIPSYEIRVDLNAAAKNNPDFDEKIDSLAFGLSQIFPDKSQSTFKRELLTGKSKSEKYFLLGAKANFKQMKAVKELPILKRGKYKGGLIIIQKNRRALPFQMLAARTIGYERQDVPPVGLEGAYSGYLKGVEGKQLMQKLSGGVWMPMDDENQVEPEDGKDLITTIDINIQDVAEYALLKQLKKHNADHGCVMLMEVQTGNVLAIANLTRNENGNYQEIYNYAIGESTEPGSTFKLASLMAAIDDGYIALDDTVNTENGKHKFYDRVMKDSNDEGYGVISVKEAFQVSSNVAVSKLIDRVYGKNPQKFIDKIKQFQLGNPLGISIPGEGKPRIKNPTDKDWSGVTLPWMSIGYELQITPAQILAFYNAVANNGKMVKPKFVTAVTKRGQNVKEFETEIISESIASNKAIKAAKAMLEAVVDRGTATNLRNPNFKIAGKTGTAQIANSKYGYKYDAQISYQASFVGYFPAEKPRYSIIVIVNAPSNNVYYGNLVAGPIFKEIADKVFATQIQLHKQLNIQKQNNTIPPVSKNGYAEDLNKVFKKLNVKTQLLDKDAEWIKTHVNENLITAKELKHTEVLVPNVMGMDAMDAIYLLENKGLQVKIFGRGEVKFQSKQPGSKITKGDAIMLELS